MGGYTEPFYRAAKDGQMAQIQFSHDYIRSALHELSHWCVAGVERRKRDDFGYWYAEDGRNQQQQNEFFKVEVMPQTIEWAFSIISGIKFEASVDNLHNQVAGAEVFVENLHQQMQRFLAVGFSSRVTDILTLFANHQGIECPLKLLAEKYKA
jgi:elongation factor P hydroxylase